MIRWKQGELKELQKKVNNYNSKVNRLIKKDYEYDIPDKMSFKQLKKSIENREQLETYKDLIKVFTVHGSEKTVKSKRGVIAPRYEKAQIQIKVAAINKGRKEKKKFYEKQTPTDRNKKLEGKMKDYRSIGTEKITDKKFNFDNMSKDDYKMYKKTLVEFSEEKDILDKRYRENFYKSLEKTLTTEQYEKIKKVLDKLSTDDIVNKYYTDLNMDIDFIYEHTDNEDMKFQEIFDSWKSVEQEQKQK